MNDELQEANWVTGIVLNIVGSFSINLGTNLIQFSHVLTEKGHQNEIKSSKPSIVFCIAWLVFVGGNLLNFLSFSYATQTVLSSLGSVQFIANILFIYMLFGIVPSKRQLSGTFMIIAGNICIVMVANKATYSFDVSRLIHLFIRTEYIVYLSVIASASLCSQLLLVYLIKQSHLALIADPREPLNGRSESSRSVSSPSQNGDDRAQTGLIMRLKSFSIVDFVVARSEVLIPTLYALISAMLGSQSVLLAKCSSLMITESTLGSDSQFSAPSTYLFLGLWVVAMIFWLYRMNQALRRYCGVFIIPVLQTSWMLFSILSGGILFREFDGYRWANYVGFAFGALIIFSGVYQLSPRRPSSAQSGARKLSESEPEISSPTSHNVGPLLSSHTSPADKLAEHEIDIDIIIEAEEVQGDVLSIATSPNPNEADTRRLKMDDEHSLNRMRNIHIPPNVRNRGAIDNLQRFFANSGRIIMKVTGADGRTHLAGPSLSNNTASSLSWTAYPNTASVTRHMSPMPRTASSHAVAQSLPIVMPSELSNAFEQIRLKNLKDTKAEDNEGPQM